MKVDVSRAGAGSGASATLGADAPRATPAASDRSPSADFPADLPQPPSERDDVSQDDRDIGWGESPRPSERDDDWYRRERPPHHD